MKAIEERRADTADRVATGLFLAVFVANVPFWARVLLLAFAVIAYAVSEGFASSAPEPSGGPA